MKLRPNTLIINATSVCQLRCPRCPVSEMGYEDKTGKGFLKFEDFKKIVDDNPQIVKIDFGSFGETVLNPDLLKMIAYGYEKKIALVCEVGVNLNNAKRELLEGMVKYRFRSLTVSIDGASEETYQKYRVGGTLGAVLENVRLINHFKKVYRSPYPRLRWQFIVFGHNEHEIPAVKKLSKSLGMEIYFKTNWDTDFSPIKDKAFVQSETGWKYTSREEYESISGKPITREVCCALWHTPIINWDGRVTGCCWNVWGNFGKDVFKNGYIETINNEKMTYAKKMIMGKAPPREDIPCDQCDLYKSMKNKNQFYSWKDLCGYFSLKYSLFNMVSQCFGMKWLPGFYRWVSFSLVKMHRGTPP